MKYGSDGFEEYPSTLRAVDSFLTNYNLVPTTTSNPSTLSSLLFGKNVLLIPEQEQGSPTIWNNLGAVIRNFVNNGGVLLAATTSANKH